MKNILNFIDGKKTLVSSLVGFGYLLGVWYGYFTYDQTVVDAIQAGVGIGLAHKLFKQYKG